MLPDRNPGFRTVPFSQKSTGNSVRSGILSQRQTYFLRNGGWYVDDYTNMFFWIVCVYSYVHVCTCVCVCMNLCVYVNLSDILYSFPHLSLPKTTIFHWSCKLMEIRMFNGCVKLWKLRNEQRFRHDFWRLDDSSRNRDLKTRWFITQLWLETCSWHGSWPWLYHVCLCGHDHSHGRGHSVFMSPTRVGACDHMLVVVTVTVTVTKALF